MDAQLGVDALGVGAHGVLGDSELLGDARHRVSACDVLHDFGLAVGEPEGQADGLALLRHAVEHGAHRNFERVERSLVLRLVCRGFDLARLWRSWAQRHKLDGIGAAVFACCPLVRPHPDAEQNQSEHPYSQKRRLAELQCVQPICQACCPAAEEPGEVHDMHDSRAERVRYDGAHASVTRCLGTLDEQDHLDEGVDGVHGAGKRLEVRHAPSKRHCDNGQRERGKRPSVCLAHAQVK